MILEGENKFTVGEVKKDELQHAKDLLNASIMNETDEEMMDWEPEEDENEQLVKKAKSFPKIAEITQSSEYIAGGAVNSHSDSVTYTCDKENGKYYAIHEEYDDICDTDDPYVCDITYDEIVNELVDAEKHENSFSDVYAGSVADIEDDVVRSHIYDEQVKMIVEEKLTELTPGKE
ncbi:MAG: hypothetical protein IKO10_16585 [Lachnospiraceae bacterium]|nr:hypothetical protein [Lachnospiraceae bacterium]